VTKNARITKTKTAEYFTRCFVPLADRFLRFQKQSLRFSKWYFKILYVETNDTTWYIDIDAVYQRRRYIDPSLVGTAHYTHME